MLLLKYLPSDPAAGASFPTSGFMSIEGPFPYVMIWAVRFNLTTSAVAGGRFPGILFGNLSVEENQRLWVCTSIPIPASLGVFAIFAGNLNQSNPDPATGGPGSGQTIYTGIPKVPLPSGASLAIQGAVDAADQIANIQIIALNGELQELMQV